MAVNLDLADLQGIIARGYGNLSAACFVLLEIVEPNAAKAWLRALVNTVTPGDARPDETSLNVAFTASGLQKLGLAPEILATFAIEFAAGMTTPHRQRILGDVAESAPEHWQWGGPNTRPVDVLLLLYARNETRLAEYYASQAGGVTAGGLAEVARLDTAPLDDFEHFGFRDAISQPIVEGLGRSGPAANTVKAGEFILGYPNEYGLYTDRPLLPPTADPQGLLPEDPGGSGARDLGRSGTYLVFRHLGQDVRGFWQFMEQAVRRPDGSSEPSARTWLAAKMVGRWPSGAPLVLAPDADNPGLGDANEFAYAREDPYGQRCPIGAHIRRAHPRDSLDPNPGSEESVAIDKRHRLLRRGRKFGSAIPPESLVQAGAAAVGDEERGLYFICLSANIARQFEFVQQTWINNPKFDGLYDDVDPLVGARKAAVFTIQAAPVRRRVLGLPRFVSVRGGAYFFLPGMRALRYLASDRR
jgi:Dyp-type peroxidase family